MVWLLLYVASIVAANVLIVTVGLVPVGFGLLAPAGVYAAGYDSADGTCLRYNPPQYVHEIGRWLDETRARPALPLWESP